MDLECVNDLASELSSSWLRFFSFSLSAYWKLFLWLRVWFFCALRVEQALWSAWSKLKLRPNLGDWVWRSAACGLMQLAVDLLRPLLEKTLEEQVLKEESGVSPLLPSKQSDSSNVLLLEKSSLLPLMTKLGGESPLVRSFANSCSATAVIFSFLLLYIASSAISALWPMRQRGAMNTFSFSSSVMARVSGESSSSILREASSEMRRVSSQLSFLRKSLALMSMMSWRSELQWVLMQRGSEQGTCSQMQWRLRSSWQILTSLMRQALCSSSRFFSISAFFSSSSRSDPKCCTSCTRTHFPFPPRSSNGQRPPYTCRIVSIIKIIILNQPSTTHTTPRMDGLTRRKSGQSRNIRRDQGLLAFVGSAGNCGVRLVGNIQNEEYRQRMKMECH